MNLAPVVPPRRLARITTPTGGPGRVSPLVVSLGDASRLISPPLKNRKDVV